MDEEEKINVPDLFKGHVKESKRKLADIVAREISAEKGVKTAAAVRFDHVSGEMIAKLAEKYPEVVTQLCRIAKKIIDGVYGVKLQELGKSLSKELLDTKTIFQLLVLKALSEQTPIPEIVKTTLKGPISTQDIENLILEPKDLNEIKINIEPGEEKVFSQTFRRYLDNMANPSHLSVGILMRRAKDIKTPVEIALSLKNSIERSLAFQKIINQLMQHENIEKAIEVIGKIENSEEKVKPLATIIDQLPNMEKIDHIIKLVETSQDLPEKEYLFQRIILSFFKNKDLKKGLKLTKSIFPEKDLQGYILSSAVKKLLMQGDIKQAILLANQIEDIDSCEDALGYIVKSYLDKKQMNEAIKFAEEIQDSILKLHTAKIILNSATVNHETKIVEEVKEKFKLI